MCEGVLPFEEGEPFLFLLCRAEENAGKVTITHHCNAS